MSNKAKPGRVFLDWAGHGCINDLFHHALYAQGVAVREVVKDVEDIEDLAWVGLRCCPLRWICDYAGSYRTDDSDVHDHHDARSVRPLVHDDYDNEHHRSSASRSDASAHANPFAASGAQPVPALRFENLNIDQNSEPANCSLARFIYAIRVTSSSSPGFSDVNRRRPTDRLRRARRSILHSESAPQASRWDTK